MRRDTGHTHTTARVRLLLLLANRTAQHVRNRRRTLRQSALAIAYDGPVAPTFHFRVCAPPIQRIVSVVFLKNRLTGPVCTQVRLHGVYSTPINVLDLVTPYDDGREPSSCQKSHTTRTTTVNKGGK